MLPNQVHSEGLLFKRFSHTEEKRRDLDDNLFYEFSTQNFECSYIFPNVIENILSDTRNSATFNAIYF